MKWRDSRGVVHSRLKSTIAIAQKYADRAARGKARSPVGDRQIQLAVVVKVSNRHKDRIRSDGIVHCVAKGAVAVAQHHTHFALELMRKHHIQLAVAVKISNSH